MVHRANRSELLQSLEKSEKEIDEGVFGPRTIYVWRSVIFPGHFENAMFQGASEVKLLKRGRPRYRSEQGIPKRWRPIAVKRENTSEDLLWWSLAAPLGMGKVCSSSGQPSHRCHLLASIFKIPGIERRLEQLDAIV